MSDEPDLVVDVLANVLRDQGWDYKFTLRRTAAKMLAQALRDAGAIESSEACKSLFDGAEKVKTLYDAGYAEGLADGAAEVVAKVLAIHYYTESTDLRSGKIRWIYCEECERDWPCQTAQAVGR